MIKKQNNIVSKAIRNSANGELCTLEIHGICNHNPETTVYAHLKSGTHGMGMKGTDLIGCYACSSCHDFIDGRINDRNQLTDSYRYGKQMFAISRTHFYLKIDGIISYDDNYVERLQKIYDIKSSKESYLLFVEEIKRSYECGLLSIKGMK